MIEFIREELTRTSGGGKRLAPGRRQNGLYCSMTLPGLDDMPAVRNTMERFAAFYVPDDLGGKTFLDVGSNVGAMAFEAARRGATTTGLEYRDDRVSLCNVIARHYEMSNATFHVADFNEIVSARRIEPTYQPDCLTYGPRDIVLCSSVDRYVVDFVGFYRWLRSLTGEVCLFESDRQSGSVPLDVVTADLEQAGFAVEYLGVGPCPFLRRKIFHLRPR